MKPCTSFITVVLCGVTVLSHSGPVKAAETKLVTEEFMIASGDPGISLYVRNKHSPEMNTVTGDKVLLYVHGATYPSETSFDLSLGGTSLMEFIAHHGYDVYLVDVRGYGRSTRPPEMDQPADQNSPIVRTDTAVRDVGAAVDFILKRRGVSKINLMGWSWGTAIMGWYAAQHNDQVNKLILYAPLWLGTPTSNAIDAGGKLGAYRAVTVESAKARWLEGVPANKKAELIPPGWFDTWAAATFATDPRGASESPAVLRAPNGILQDRRDYWLAGKPLYDPGLIRVPTFLVHAEWDQELPNYMLYDYFAKLTHAPYKRYIQIGEGTHTVMLEKNRMQLFSAVQAFLDENFKAGD
jgi:pimeloyl-ACP methyl ester carboxylesterase